MLRKRLFAALACGLFSAMLTLGCAQTQAAQGSGELDPASRVRHVGDVPPRLGTHDAELYRQIFALQERAEWERADGLMAQLNDPVLLGHVLYQRYMHPTGYRSRFEELSGWLKLYADHPGAERVHDLALRRRPPGAPLPEGPVPGYLAGAGQELQERGAIRYRSSLTRSPEADALVGAWQDTIAQLAATGQPGEAERELRRPEIASLVDHVEFDLARCTIARGYLAVGDARRALTLARGAAARSARALPELHWNAGWRLGGPAGFLWRARTLQRWRMPSSTGFCLPSAPGRRFGQRARIWWACVPAWSATICALRRAGVTSTGSWPAPR
jgi:soluble lytic murein transglycosylase